MGHASAYVIWLGSFLLLSGAVMFSVSIGLDTFVEVSYVSAVGSTGVTDTFGVFTWEVDHDHGMDGNTSWRRYAVDCINANSLITPGQKTDKPSPLCASQCQSKKAFAIIGAVTGFLALTMLIDFREGRWFHLWIHRESTGFRIASAFFGTIAFFSGVIVMSLFHQQMGEQTYLVGAGTTSQAYSEKMGVCAYKLGKTDSLAVTSYDDPGYGPAFWVMFSATIAYGLGTLAIAFTREEDSAEAEK